MDPYLGEIRLFAGNFAPRGWAICDGRLLPISQNTALFSILGAQYGGNGQTNFALPDMRGRAPMHQGVGLGLTPRTIGESGGEAGVTLTTNGMPAHAHVANNVTQAATADPTNALWATPGRGGTKIYSDTPTVTLNLQAIGVAGGSQPHNNMQPNLTLNFIIALEGVFPPRN